MIADSHATAVREMNAEKKQINAAYKKAQEVCTGLEQKLEQLRVDAQKALVAHDNAQQQHEAALESQRSAQQQLEDASPAHLRERMHAANLKRVSATGVKEKAEEAISNGAAHEELLLRRVNEIEARIKALEASALARSERVDNLQAELATDQITLKAKKDEQAVFLEENQGLESERQELTEQRATLRVRNEERLKAWPLKLQCNLKLRESE